MADARAKTADQQQYTLREATVIDISELVSVQIQAWRETYLGIIHSEFLERMSHTAERVARWWVQWPLSVTFVAVDLNDSSIVGFATVGKRRSMDDCTPDIQRALGHIDGELYAIYLLKKAHKKGLGAKLFMLASRAARQKFQLTKLRCWVLTENKLAKGFYVTIGGQYSGVSKMCTIEQRHYPEECYVWNEIQQ